MSVVDAPEPTRWCFERGEAVFALSAIFGEVSPLCVELIKARKRLDAMPRGAVLRVIATDPAAQIDVPHFCNEQGHELVAQERRGDEFVFRIRRK